MVWKYVKMRQNMYITTSDVKNIFFKNLILVVSKYEQMHQNMYITTSDVK